jgi:O-glycosyl hydrolase
MEKFSIERDRKALLPLLKEILSRNDGTFKVWASPWCPPLWMKKSGAYASKPQTDPTWPKNDCSPEQRVREGEDGFLCDDVHFAAYAKYFRKYVDAYRAEGVQVWMVMPQNEFNSDQVFPSCTWQAKSLAAFVGKHLGPALEGSGTELYFGTMERPSLEMARTILDDPDCRRYMKGAGFQWAGKGAIGKVRERFSFLPTDCDLCSVGDHTKVAFKTERAYCPYVRIFTEENIADVISVGYKYAYFEKRLVLPLLSQKEKRLLLTALVAADDREDRAYALKRLVGFEQ